MTPARAKIVWPLLAALPSLVAMRGLVCWDRIFYWRDNAGMFFPIHQWFRATVAAGVWPVWDPYLALGQPAIADPTRQLLFPPVLLLRFVPWEALGYNLIVGLPFPVAAIGVYALARRWVARPAAAVAGIVFSASSTVLSTASMPNMSWSVALAPWVMLALVAAAHRPVGWRFAVAAAAVGLQTLAGEPVTLAATAAFSIASIVVVSDGSWRMRASGVAVATAAAATGLLVAAVQLLPLAETVALAARGDGNLHESWYWSLHPYRLLEFVVPFPFGDATVLPFEDSDWAGRLSDANDPLLPSHYLGLGTLVLAAVGLVDGDRRRVRCWAGLGCLALLCALGSYTVVYPALQTVLPFAGSFRFPEKFAVFTVLAVALLAAEALDVASLSSAATRWAAGVAAGGFACIAATGLVGLAIAAAAGAGHGAAVQFGQALWQGAPVVLASGAGVAGLMLLARRRPDRRSLLLVGVAATIAVDLVAAGAWLNPQAPVELFRAPEWARAVDPGSRVFVGQRLTELFGHSRFAVGSAPDPDAFRARAVTDAALPPALAEAVVLARTAGYSSRFGLEDAVSHDVAALFSREYHVFAAALLRQPAAERRRALERLGVRTWLHAAPPGSAGDVDGLPGLAIQRSIEPVARYALVPGWYVETDPVRAAERLAGLHGEPAGRVAVAATVRVEWETDDAAYLQVDAPERVTVVAFASYHPGWTVEVDDKAATVVRVDGVLRGVHVALGSHRVVWRFRPASLTRGAVVSGVTILVLIGMSMFWRPRKSVIPPVAMEPLEPSLP